MTTRPSGGRLARFDTVQAEPERTVGLPADHRAVVGATTLFPSRISGVDAMPRLLISGHNNAKIGKLVTKGEWVGMPIFTLTLTERATCPASCAVFKDCYGNAMQWSSRIDHTDPLFLDTLRAEIITTARAHPKGMVVRLHVLGDFYSVAYVQMWAEMFDRFPQLRSFAYTARSEDDDDEDSRRIAKALTWLSDQAYDQFALRFSRASPGPNRAIVVDEPSTEPDVITCPAQLHQSETCGTCGLCWAPAARQKTIAFLRHGIKRAPATPKPAVGSDRKPRARRNPSVQKFATAGRPLIGALPGETVEDRRNRVRSYFLDHPEATIASVVSDLGVPVSVVADVAAHLIQARLHGAPPKWKPPQKTAGVAPDKRTTEERLAAVPESEKERIARMYGATFKPKTAGGE